MKNALKYIFRCTHPLLVYHFVLVLNMQFEKNEQLLYLVNL